MKKNASISEIASYAAGMIDGEGSISIHKIRSPYKDTVYTIYSPFVSVTNTNYDALQWFSEKFGGTIIVHTKAGAFGHKRTCWRWSIRNTDGVNTFVRLVFPYLIIKRQQAIILLNFLNDDNQDKERWHLDMQEENEKGGKQRWQDTSVVS